MKQIDKLYENIEQLKELEQAFTYDGKRFNDIDNLLLQHINAKLVEFKTRIVNRMG